MFIKSMTNIILSIYLLIWISEIFVMPALATDQGIRINGKITQETKAGNYDYQLASQHIELKQYDQALKILNEGILIFPDQARFYNLIAKVHFLKGSIDASTLWYQKAISKFPDNTELVISMGQLYIESGRADEAVSILNKAVENNSQRDELYGQLGDIYKNSHKFQEALTWYKMGIKETPGVIRNYARIASIFILQRKFKKALEWLNKGLNKNPDNQFILQEIGNAYSGLGEYQKALDYYQRASKVSKADSLFTCPYGGMGLAYKKLKNPSQSEASFKVHIEMTPSDYLGYLNLGLYYLEVGKNQLAQENLQRAFQLSAIESNRMMIATFQSILDIITNKTNPNIRSLTGMKGTDNLVRQFFYFSLGFENYRKGQNKQSIEYFKKAVEFLPDDTLDFAWIGLAWNFLDQFDYMQALDAFKNANEVNPINVYSLTGIGFCYLRLKSFAKAKIFFLKALKVNPEFPFGLAGLGICHVMEGKLSQADTLFKKILITNSTKRSLSLFYEGLGLLNYKQGHNELAEQHYLKSIETGSSKDHNPFDYLAELYFETKRIEKAIDYLKKSISIFPQGLYAKQMLQQCSTEYSKIKEPISVYK